MESVLKKDNILGQYKILKFIKRSGMGDVYIAENIQTMKKYALKVLSPEFVSNDFFVSKFKVEARVMSDLIHDNIVRVRFLEQTNEQLYLVMDYIDGPDGPPKTLKDLLAEKKCINEDVILEYLFQMCEALDYTFDHKNKGLIHKDLKPVNILIDFCGELKITDFGLFETLDNRNSKLINSVKNKNLSSLLDNVKTAENTLIINYIAPEVIEYKNYSRQSDIFSLGTILYELLTNELPKGNWKLPSEYGRNKKWDKIVVKCLATTPEERYDDALSVYKSFVNAEHSNSFIGSIVYILIIIICLLIFAVWGIINILGK